MNLGEKILKLRKQKRLSQETLAEQIGVSRQTISNWELNITSPNVEQLKKLSSVLNVSADELLDNNVKEILTEKISNTEILAGIIIKILKIFGIILIAIVVINIIIIILFNTVTTNNVTSESGLISLKCELNGEVYKYQIEYDNRGITSYGGSEYIDDILEDKEFASKEMLVKYIEDYFEKMKGKC